MKALILPGADLQVLGKIPLVDKFVDDVVAVLVQKVVSFGIQQPSLWRISVTML
jgi:hypothetical protein